MTYFIWFAYQSVNHGILLSGTYILIIGCTILLTTQSFKNNKLVQRYSFISAFYAQSISVNFIFFYTTTYSRFDNITEFTFPPMVVIVISFITALLLILNYANIFVFPELLREEVENKYAHLKLKLA